jgi:hypothetical protein
VRSLTFVVILLVSSTAAAADLDFKPEYALGARIRGLWVTQTMLSPYLQSSTNMQNASLGLEFIYRKRTYDVVTSLDFSFVSPADGNYLGAGKDPTVDTHYVEFRNLNFLSVDVSIIGHNWLTKWKGGGLEIRYGAGLGLGAVLGDILETNNDTNCGTMQGGVYIDPSNTTLCHPRGILLNQTDTQAKLKATEAAYPAMPDVAQDPHRHIIGDKPPVMAVLNILLGFNFRVHPHASIDIEAGFRDAMFFGFGAHYWF